MTDNASKYQYRTKHWSGPCFNLNMEIVHCTQGRRRGGFLRGFEAFLRSILFSFSPQISAANTVMTAEVKTVLLKLLLWVKYNQELFSDQ